MQNPGLAAERPLKSYRVSMTWRVLLVLLGVPLVGLFVWVGVMPFTDGFHRSLFAMILLPAMALGMITVFILGILDAFRSALHLYPDRIVKREVFKTRELKIADLEGFRFVQSQYTKNIVLFPKKKTDKKIKLSNTFVRFGELSGWVAQTLPDLDAREAAAEQQSILNDREYGSTERERSELLGKYRTVTKYLNNAGIAVGLWAFIYPRPYEILIVLCALFPLAGIMILVQSNGLVHFDERKNSAHPSIVRMFMMPALALALRSLLDFSIIDAKQLLLPVLAITAVFSGLMLAKLKEFTGKAWIKLLPIIFAAVYAYGLTVMGNCLFDRSQPEVFTVRVLNKHVTTGRSTTYYVKLAPWGPVAEADDAQVTREQYEQIQIGKEVYVGEMPGIMKIPWFFISLD